MDIHSGGVSLYCGCVLLALIFAGQSVRPEHSLPTDWEVEHTMLRIRKQGTIKTNSKNINTDFLLWSFNLVCFTVYSEQTKCTTSLSNIHQSSSTTTIIFIPLSMVHRPLCHWLFHSASTVAHLGHHPSSLVQQPWA